MVTISDVKALAGRIAQQFDPDKIILFGSYAYGTPDADSDVDLLVILPVAGKNWRKAAEIRSRIRSPFPIDLLVRTPEEVESRLKDADPFLREIAERRLVLHEKDHARVG